MKFELNLSDGSHSAVLNIPESVAVRSAIDVVMDVIGSDDVQSLAAQNILSPGDVDELRALQSTIFDTDDQGKFIREEVFLKANGKDLNPDGSLMAAFLPPDASNVRRAKLTVHNLNAPVVATAPAATSVDSGSSDSNDFKEFAQLFFLHQIAVGNHLDVTKDYPELAMVLKEAEKAELIEVDVKNASYKLTAKGKQRHDEAIAEAQDVIRRFDIFIDVDFDSNGIAHFDSGLGRDLRVPVFEIERVNPFRARFLVGLNDGEWDKLENWVSLVEEEDFYAKMMEPVERAPSVEELGADKLRAIIEQGKAKLRNQPQYN